MKTTETTNNRTVLKWLGIALGLGATAYFSYQVLKSIKKIEKKEEKEKKDLENLGISSEKMKKEVRPHEKQNFVKKLFVSTAFKAEAIVPDDSLDTEEAWDQSNVIHIFQKQRSEVNTNRNFRDAYNQNFLEFVLGIPDYLKDNRTKLHISDYIKCMKDAADHMSSKIIRFTPDAEKELFGFLKIKYENPDYDETDEYSFKELEGFLEIPSWVYKCYEDEKGHGLTELYKMVTLENTFGEADEAIQKLLGDHFPGLKVSVKYMGLAYRIVFPIQDDMNPYGIVLKSGLECIDYLCNEFSVDKSHSNKYSNSNDETTYDRLIFHAPNRKGIWSWEKFYDINRSNNQVEYLDYNYR